MRKKIKSIYAYDVSVVKKALNEASNKLYGNDYDENICNNYPVVKGLIEHEAARILSEKN